MRAHQLDGNNVIVNTIVVSSLDDLPNLIDASLGGTIGSTYDPDTQTFTSPAQSGPTLIAPLAFLERFTKAERGSIRAAAATDDDLADWIDLLRASNEVDLESAQTTGGMQALVDAGLISSSRRDEILTP